MAFVLLTSIPARAQETTVPPARNESGTGPADSPQLRPANIGKFLGGAAVALVSHEGGHLLFGSLFHAGPGTKRIHYGPIPFFAITYDRPLSARRRYVVSSAGFWEQHATSEAILFARPHLRTEHAPFLKGILAFNILASVAYGVNAIAGAGPIERDTRGIADAAGIREGWIGAMILAPAVLDAWRYRWPDAAWARWASRAVKAGLVILTAKRMKS